VGLTEPSLADAQISALWDTVDQTLVAPAVGYDEMSAKSPKSCLSSRLEIK